MINLLPPDLKQDYRFAKQNTRLLNILSTIGIGLVGLAMILAFGFIYLGQVSSSYNEQAKEQQTILKNQNQSQIEKSAKSISDDLTLAIKVLSKEILFSKLLQQLAIITPESASLSGISISDIEGSVTITAQAKDYNSATQLQVNLEDPANEVFASADTIGISCLPEEDSESKYPCTVNIRALFSNDSPYLFINNQSDGN